VIILDLLLLLFLAFLVSTVVQVFSRRGGFTTGEGDSLKRTQAMSHRTAAFSGMSAREEEQYHDSLSIGVCFSRFALQVAAADGGLTQAELTTIISFFRGAHPNYVEHIQEVLLSDIADPTTIDWDYNLQEARRILAKPGWESFGAILFDGLVRISMADGRPGEREHQVIYNIMRGLGWTDAQTSSWFRGRTASPGGGGDNGERFRSSGRAHTSQPGDNFSEACDILGVKPDDSMETIKKRYRQLVREHHPDRYAQMGEEMQKSATVRFQTIQRAYETLEAAKK